MHVCLCLFLTRKHEGSSLSYFQNIFMKVQDNFSAIFCQFWHTFTLHFSLYVLFKNDSISYNCEIFSYISLKIGVYVRVHAKNIYYCIHRSGGYYGFGRSTPPPPQCVTDFTVTALAPTVFYLELLYLQVMFSLTKSCLGIFLASFWKTRWPPEPFFDFFFLVFLHPLTLAV